MRKEDIKVEFFKQFGNQSFRGYPLEQCHSIWEFFEKHINNDECSKPHQSAEDILREYISFDDVNQSEPVEILPLTIVDAMEEYLASHQEVGESLAVYMAYNQALKDNK